MGEGFRMTLGEKESWTRPTAPSAPARSVRAGGQFTRLVTKERQPSNRASRLRDMNDKKGQNRKRRPPRGDPEMRVVGIDFNPAPDAEERLHRLFIILFRLVEDHPTIPCTAPSPDEGREGKT